MLLEKLSSENSHFPVYIYPVDIYVTAFQSFSKHVAYHFPVFLIDQLAD